MNSFRSRIEIQNAGRPFGVEIQHLLTFLAVYEERGVTAAAKRLGRTQSALSHSLSKFRELMCDELFVARSGEMWPTAEAQQLYPRIKDALELINGLHVKRRAFDPLKDSLDLRVGMTDHAQKLFSPSIWARIAQVASGVRLIVHAIDRFDAESLLLDGGLDLAIVGDPVLTRPEVLCDELLTDDFVVAAAQADDAGTLDMTTYLATDHLGVASNRSELGVVDSTLRAMGCARNVRCVVPAYTQVPALVASSRLLATFARGVFADANLGLHMHVPPFHIEPVRISLLYLHPARSSSAQRWAAQLVRDAARQSGVI